MAAPPPPVPHGVPVTVSADQARELAAQELAKPAYRAAEPGFVQQVGQWLLARLSDLVELLTSTRAGGAGGVLVVLALIVVLVVVVRWRLGRAARTARVGSAALDPTGTTAADHRRRAAEHEAAGHHDEAVREWMRALVRGLEERDLLATRAGRTAGEAAREAGAALPAAAEAIADAARCFDETVYGGHPADADAVARVRAADETVRATRPVPA
ncbi:DUF4129 domain-containing protein [Actinomycetospora endophytica]|uniref:DUF4129 domain-containing protein n=1 Tax=Actinomycetospora endophytica TaxID=2291215 RepID=A0ABS8P9S8_9PSEU|nr:DUF4129 domain-containing protein [Actinomycetospora endophytica]MCD2195021.1 DUF4129 domain-containing protein [Actinomycetospora endophytica]